MQSDEAYASAVKEYAVRRDIFGADAVAWTALKANRIEEAQTAMEQALRLGTQDAKLFYHAGMIARAAGDETAARQHIARAIALNPRFDPLQAFHASPGVRQMTGSWRDRSRALARRVAVAMMLGVCVVAGIVASAMAHPLGNFTVNQYSRLTVGADRIDLRYVIDMAEISALQELQRLGASGDGKPTASELDRYLESIAADYVSGLVLTVDDKRVPLDVTAKTISLPPGAGGLPTLRIEMNLVGAVQASSGDPVRRLTFEDRNRRERIGWREIVVGSINGTTVFNSSAYGNGLTDELKAYPQDMLAAPLREEAAGLSFTRGASPRRAQRPCGRAMATRSCKRATGLPN